MSVAIPGLVDPEHRLEELAEGKPEAFEAFFESWFPRIHRFAARRSSSGRSAARVTERVMLRAVEEVRQGSRPVDLGEWLLAMLKAELARDDAMRAW